MGATLLIIDDTQTIRDHVKSIVLADGTFENVLEAGDGMSGFKMLLAHEVDLVVCDVVMPGADGFKFLLLKRRGPPEVQEIPVLMLTTQSSSDMLVRTLNAGALDHITKPFNENELLARLRAHLELRRSRTELRATRDHLARSQAHLNSVIEAMADGMLVLNSDERIENSNSAFCSLTGYESSELVGRPFKEILAEFDVLSMTGVKAAFLKERSVSGMTVTFRTADGKDLPAAVTGSLLQGVDGEVGGIVLVTRDARDLLSVMQGESREVAREREHTQQLRSEREELEKQTREQLEHAQTLVTQAERLSTIGQMVASIGHEINSPLYLISNCVGSLGQDVTKLTDMILSLLSADSEQAAPVRAKVEQHREAIAGWLELTNSGIERLTDVSHALRTQARLEPLPTRGIDVNSVVREAMVIAGGKIKMHVVDTELGDLLPITCFRTRVGQVVTNLLVNACDALMEKRARLKSSPEGVGTFLSRVVVRTEQEQRESETGVLITISDNGDGISDDNLANIFEEFYTTKPAGEGTGLGLAMCQKIVEEHGGNITAGRDDELGGASFRVWLPVSGGSVADVLNVESGEIPQEMSPL